MKKFRVRVSWQEIHSNDVEIEANSIEEANEFAKENLRDLIWEAREIGDSYIKDNKDFDSCDNIKEADN